MIPKYYGDVITNLGTGSLFEFILDHNGAVSKNLGYYINSNELIETYYNILSNSLFFLKDYLLKHQILTTTLACRNILCQRNKSGICRLFIVDNIGNTDYIPICDYVRCLAKNKILQR